MGNKSNQKQVLINMIKQIIEKLLSELYIICCYRRILLVVAGETKEATIAEEEIKLVCFNRYNKKAR